MSYQIHLKGPGLNMITRVKDEALNDLLRLLQEHHDTEGDVPHFPEGPPRGPRGMGQPPPHRPTAQQPDSATLEERTRKLREFRTAKKAKLKAHPEASALGKKLEALTTPPLADHADFTFPEKLLLLGAWTETKGEKFILRGPALVEAMVRAGQTPPANGMRDVMSAINSGWLSMGLFPNPNRAELTPEGWLHLTALLSD